VVALTASVHLEPDDPRRLAALRGPFAQNHSQLERRLGIRIGNRGNQVRISGQTPRVQAAGALLVRLYQETERAEAIPPETVHLYLQEAGMEELLSPEGEAEHVIRTRRKTIKLRGRNQATYVDAMRRNDICFGVGPAGTGKTYLAVAAAVEALENRSVSRRGPAVIGSDRLPIVS